MRPSHRLNENKKTNLPNRFVTYDTETYAIENADDTKTHKLKVGVAFYWKMDKERLTTDKLVFYDVKTFWNWVETKTAPKKKLYVFAHNAQFDSAIVNMFGELPKRDWNLDKNIIDSNIFIVRWTKGIKGKKGNARSMVCLDSMNFFKSSIKDIGEKIGLPKLEIDIEKSVKTKIVTNELITYCTRDVEITEKILLEWFNFLKKNDLGNFQPTVASQAFTSFRHRFMNEPIYIHDNDKAIALERESYKGGRNECFYIGSIKNKVSVYDFNSLYPSVMKENIFPTNLVSFREQNNIRTLTDDLSNYLVIAELTIKIEKPLVAHRKERLLFPVGTFKGVFCSPEIEVLLKRNCIVNVGKVTCYEGAKIFEEYVTFFYNERLKAKENKDKVSDELIKIMLNSLYGKFGQRLRKNEIIGTADNNDISVKTIIEPNETYTTKTFGGKIFKTSTTKEESYNSFPAVASFCTAYARMKLLNAIEKAEWENVYYVDTDSLFINEIGKEKLSDLIDQSKLGYLKLEYEAPLGMIIKGCKDYIIFKKNYTTGQTEKIEKIKGIPKKACKNSINEYELIKFDKFATSLRHGNLDSVTQRNMIKQLSREYTKGIITKQGIVIPYKFNEG
jgi:hypothetical protein